MALIKSKQIESITAAKVIESDDKKFITLKQANDLHVHVNNKVLDKFTEINGKVQYDGEEIAGSTKAVTTASGITVVDIANNFKSVDKNIENILTELFTSANNAIDGKKLSLQH